MTGQLETLQTLINMALDHGWKIEKGDILLTGSIGKMVPAKSGRYIVNYGQQSSLVFDIR